MRETARTAYVREDLADRQSSERAPGSVRVTNRDGSSPILIVCDHASNWLPPELGTLGLTQADMLRHIAWDPGALPVALKLSGLLDAALIEAGVSRLAIDCNRPLDAPGLIAELSETTVIPGNASLDARQREERIAMSWRPFHDAIEALVEERTNAGKPTWVVSIHSFNPVYNGVSRPWEIGIIHDEEERLSAPLIAGLKDTGLFTVGVNEPYSPADNVYFTLERHARSRALPCAMVEIRNDEISDDASQARWAGLLARIVGGIEISGVAGGRDAARTRPGS